MENSLFLSLLPVEKADALRRGERVEITAEEAGRFRREMDRRALKPCPSPCLFRPE